MVCVVGLMFWLVLLLIVIFSVVVLGLSMCMNVELVGGCVVYNCVRWFFGVFCCVFVVMGEYVSRVVVSRVSGIFIVWVFGCGVFVLMCSVVLVVCD